MTAEVRFEVFFKQHYHHLCSGVYKIIRDQSVAEDLVQEVFLRVWEKRASLDFNEQFLGYLKKACYYEALQHLAYHKTQLQKSENLRITTEENQQPLLQQELEKAVISAINSLPEKTRLVFTLSRYEELTYKQIADQLNISVKAVEKHMGKALKLLKEQLREFLAVALFYLLQ